MPSYSAEAIVLRKSNFGEADQVVTLLTRFKGKVSAVAKGVRLIQSRKGGNLDLLNHVRVQLAEGKNMDIITEVDLVSAWPKIKVDLERVALAYQIAELSHEFLAEHQENKEVFELTRQSLEYLEKSDKPELIVQAYELKLLNLLGFRPELEHCVRCGIALPSIGLALSPELGGAIGPEEREMDETSWGISSDVLKVWRYLMSVPMEDVGKLKLPSPVANEVSRSLQYYLEHILEKELKSPGLLTSVKNLPKGAHEG